MKALTIVLAVLFVVATAAAFPPPAPLLPMNVTDSGALADKIRELEQRLARLECLQGVDLVVPGMQAAAGVWQLEGREIVSPDDPVALLQLPRHPPEEYIVTLRVRRISGKNTFAVGIPIGGRQVLVALDAHAGTVSGLEHLDGRFVHENEAAYRGALFVPDKVATVAITVRKDRITCAFDDTTVIDWRGDAQRLSLAETFVVPDCHALFLATLGSSYAVSEIRISPVEFPVWRLDDSGDRENHKRSGDGSGPRGIVPPHDSALQVTAGSSEPGAAESAEAADPAAAERLARCKERWKLQLLPEKLPEVGPRLLGTGWAQHGPRNILGRGIARFIRFQRAVEPGEKPAIVLTTVEHHGVNAGNRQTETTKSFPLATPGPFLEYDGLIHTAFVTADEKRFIPDAVLRIADRQWYCARSRRLADEKGAPPAVEVAEYLFDFNDDPVQQRNGKLTLHQCIHKAGDAGDVTHAPMRFVLFHHDADETQPYEVQVGTPSGRSLTVNFYAGQDFAEISETPRANGIYLAEKEK